MTFEIKSTNFVAKLRIENRRGKKVTLIDGLPKIEPYLKDLCKTLKNKYGAGGTYHLDGKEGAVEIQGDQRDSIREWLNQKGIKTKG